MRPGGSGDFMAPYVAAYRFARYANPYTADHFVEDWHAAGAPASQSYSKGLDSVGYPPLTLLVLSPYARLPWKAATRLHAWICSALYLLLICLASVEVGRRWSDPKRLFFLCFALALAPVQTGIHQGNLSILSFLCCGYALLFLQGSKGGTAAGLLCILAIFIKPTLGLTLLVFFLVTRRWRATTVCLVTGVLLAAGTEVRLLHIDPVWKVDYQAALTQLLNKDGMGSFTRSSAAHFDLINLQMPVYEATRSILVANIAAWTICSLFTAVWLVLMLKRHRVHAPRSDWADIGALFLLSMIPVYQRNYNAAILLFSLLWAFRNLERRSAKAVLALSLVFVVPGEGWLRGWLDPRLPSAIGNNYFWRVIVIPHAAWAILPLACLMLLAMGLPEKASPGRDGENSVDASSVAAATD